MADLALVSDGQVVDTNPASKQVRERLRAAREHRKQFEPIWQMSAAMAAGQGWLVADRLTRTLQNIQQVDPAYANRELYTADMITEYRTTALGELGSDDDRPELLLQHDDRAAEEYQAQVNRALGYAWDFEFRGDEALAEADRLCVDLGTSAIQCYFDASQGAPRGQVPYHDGAPQFGQQAHELFANGPNPDVQMRQVNEGRICWRPLAAPNLLVPPGIVHERYFPWECVVMPTLLDEVQAEFGGPARDLKEDTDISSQLGLETTQGTDPAGYMIGAGRRTRLRDHVWLFTYYERPTSKFPQGRTLVYGGNNMKLLRVEKKLPYQAPDGTWRSGISYFHWWRVTGRFWSRSLVDSMKDIQRAINKRKTQINEIIDRGMPFVLVEEGSNLENRKGTPVEVLSVKKQGAGQPVIHNGIPPGDWLFKDVEAMREDIQHATGIRSPSLGENPANVGTYSQLALLHEADQIKRSPILRERKLAIKGLVEDTVYDIRTYWGRDKQVRLAGDDGRVSAELFDATRIPPFFIVQIAKGTAKPRSQAAELKKVEQIWQAAIDCAAIATDPQKWIEWYDKSLAAGQALEIPASHANEQADKAQLENHLLLAGQPAQVAYYDPPDVHIPIHRSAQIDAELSHDFMAAARIEQHVQEHLHMAQQLAQEQAAIQAPPMAAQQDAQAQYDQAQQQQQGGGPGAPPAPAAAPAPAPEPTPAPPQHLTIHLPDHYVHVAPTPVQVDHHSGPVNVHVPPTPVNVHVPAHKPPPAAKGKKKIVIERDARGNITGADLHHG